MAAEKKANPEFEKLCAQMRAAGYTGKDVTFSAMKANILAFAAALPIAAVFGALYFYRWRNHMPEAASGSFHGTAGLLAFLGVFALSILVHEALHAVTWAFSCKRGLKSVRIRFALKTLTPYSHCAEPLRGLAYGIGVVMPVMVLGALPFVLSLMIPNLMLAAFGIISILAAGGDLAILFLLLRHHKGLIFDHPTDCGFVLFQKENGKENGNVTA